MALGMVCGPPRPAAGGTEDGSGLGWQRESFRTSPIVPELTAPSLPSLLDRFHTPLLDVPLLLLKNP
eukprot:765742-Hanusia_phi.AAC.3